MTCSQGDVVLVPFPFTDLTTTKQRPAVVVSADWFNRLRSDCVIVAITSQIPPQLDRDHFSLSPSDLASSGLPKSSVVKMGKLLTIDQNLIRKPLGTLPSATLQSLLQGIHSILS